MNASWQSRIIDALDLPESTRVNQRVPKKLLVENGAPTAADKKKINEGIEEIHWLAALKPNTIGVAEYRDDIREYLEIALLSVILRPGAKASRLAELVHRAVPYPVVLIMVQGDQTFISLAHKRRAQNEADKFVLDGESVEVAFGNASLSLEVSGQFLEALTLSGQPRASLWQLYQGWIDTIVALQASQVTGVFSILDSKDAKKTRREAVQKCSDLETKIAVLRNAASKEKQIARRVEMNQTLSKLYAEKIEAKNNL